MQDMRPGKDCGNGSAVGVAALPTAIGLALALGMVVLAGGCSSIATPLPDLKPATSTSMSAQDQRKAVDELNKKGETHEQEAEKQIEQSR